MAVKFVGRNQWGAKPPKAMTKLSPSALAGVAVHWFGKPRAAKSARRLRGSPPQRPEHPHEPRRAGRKDGGNDIAYNHAVCPHGHAFTLRGFGVQTGANGDPSRTATTRPSSTWRARATRRRSDEVRLLIADVIRAWQAKGAGPLVKPHQFFTGSDCPGPDLLKWVDLKPRPWKGKRKDAAVALRTRRRTG